MNTGEEVVCVRGGSKRPWESPPVIKNTVYTVHSAIYCKCGEVALQVGILTPMIKPHDEWLCNCGALHKISISEQALYCGTRFAPLSHLDFVLDEVHELLNPEVFQPCR